MRKAGAAVTLLLCACLLGLPLGPAAQKAAAAGLADAQAELIVAPDSFVNDLLPLKAWREAQGVRVDIVTTTFAQQQMNGSDLQASIKAFIATRRAADPNLAYVLLAADDPIIPARTLQVANRTAGAALLTSDRSLASDFYYAAGGASFYNSSDPGDDLPLGPAWYGISDDSWSLNATLHVGRLPAKSASDVRAYVSRLIAWEQNPPSGLWQSRAVLGLAVASVPDASFGARRLSDDAGVAFASVESRLEAAGVQNISLRDYPNWPAAYDPLADALDDPTFLGEWDLGASLVVLAARDSPLQGGPGEGYAGDGSSSVFAPVASPGALSARGNGGKLPLYIAAYGGSGNFSAQNDTDIERAVMASSGGAALAVGFTGRTGIGGQPGGPLGGWTLAADAARELIDRPAPIGVVLDRARERFLEDARAALGSAFDANNASLRAAVAGLTLLGDPAALPMVGPLRSLDVSAPAGVAPNTTSEVAVTVRFGGAAVPNATVAALDKAGDLQAVAVADAQGVARITLTTGARANWKLVVTAAGFSRAEVALAVDTPPTVAVITPGAGTSIGGRLNFTGAAGDSDPGDTIAAVEVSLNGGPWVPALGRATWSFDVDTTLLQNGPNTFAARASDGTIWSAPNLVRFNVTNPKPPALLSPYEQLSFLEDTSFTFALNLTDHFAPSGPGALLLAEARTNDPLNLSLNGSLLTLLPAPNFFGPAVVELTVFDSFGGSVRLNLSVNVIGQDDPPVLTVGSTYTVEEGGTVNFDPMAFDPDGTRPTVYLLSGPAGATATGWVTPRGSAGVHLLVIAATDGRFIVTAEIEVTVTVHNDPPSARVAGPDRAEAGREVSFAAQGAADADGDPLTFAWDFGDGQVAHGEEASHVYAAPGNYTVTLSVSDGRQSVDILHAVAVDPYRQPPAAPTLYAAAIVYLSVAVILACAVLACYLLFFSRPREAPPEGEGEAEGQDRAAARGQGEEE